MKTDNFSNQLRWVVLLLAAAVILPTVCLLWFMNQAVMNVQLAVHSKLRSVYHGEINKDFEPLLEWINTENLNAQKILSEDSPYEAFRKLADSETDFQSYGLFIYDTKNKTKLYPAPWNDFDTIDDLPQIQEAMRLEFDEKDLNAALDQYKKIEEDNPHSTIFKHCKLAQARIFHKQNFLETAVALCETAQSEPLDSTEDWNLYTSANLKILSLLEELGLEEKAQIDRFNARMNNLLNVIDRIEWVACEQRIFCFRQIANLAEKHREIISRNTRGRISELENRINLQHQSLLFLSEHPDFLNGQLPDSMLETIEGSNLYALNLQAGPQRAVRLIDIEGIIRTLSQDLDFSGDVHYRIINSDKKVIVGPTTTTYSPFLDFSISSWLDWTVEFYENQADSNVFMKAAQRQSSIYIWTGLLVIVLVILAGAISIHSVNRQIKMNRLKNDFIATVTHELKTPLSSMRLLVDTLLEGRYKDESTVNEYLQMVSNENKRLTHLIDSFLTFSRMERNKQVFDFQPVAPDAIATAAMEAMQAKLSAGDCHFEHHIEENLPAVSADIDGMVTVLVNLLDNACKYTNGDKSIKLVVYSQNGQVCFAVTDNGIGISKRIQKKIFNRFYQLDSRLSRRSEGCGLGLSIVKFIVDAHKGTIELKSELTKGSTFTVKLPTA